MLHARMRVEEKMLVDALEARGASVEVVDLREERFDLEAPGRWSDFDVVLDRSLSLTASITAVRILEHFGVRCVNSSRAIETCSDKLRTTMALLEARVATPRVMVATSPEPALSAIEDMGYPVVLKPTIGSWGRMVSRVNDRDAAEAIVEHRDALGSPAMHVYYVQEHVEKPGRDLRVFVVGGAPIAAISRSSAHWVTNTARGATAAGHPIDAALATLCTRAAAAVGGDVVAIDVLECPRRGYLVNEINHSMEFRNSVATSGVDIPGLVADHVLRIAAERSRTPMQAAGATR